MLGSRSVIAKKSKDEGEKPFWISYADLMTALIGYELRSNPTSCLDGGGSSQEFQLR